MRLGDLDAIRDSLGVSDEDIIFKEILDDAPTIDAVHVVRCKDCKYFAKEAIGEDGWCENPDGLDNIAKQTDFCSYGEKRKDGD